MFESSVRLVLGLISLSLDATHSSLVERFPKLYQVSTECERESEDEYAPDFKPVSFSCMETSALPGTERRGGFYHQRPSPVAGLE